MIYEALRERKLPDVLQMNDGTRCADAAQWEIRRAEIVDLFSREVYGYMPAPPTSVECTVISVYENAVADFGFYNRIRVSFETPKGPFSFEADLYVPKHVIKAPLLIHLQFQDSPLFRVWPVEDIVKNGFATVMIRYWDIMPDVNDFSQGLAGMYLKGDEREPTEWGAIGCWAFAASRMLDALQGWECIDHTRAAIVGHSRLGKTAMWCAANDTRFQLAVINGSGNSGASLSRQNEGERIDYITKTFPHWFCTNYYKYAHKEEELPFDQHFILSALAPRSSYNCSGNDDWWAGPPSEFLCSLAASPVYEMLGKKGLVTPHEMPNVGDFLCDGSIAYSLHDGAHYLGRFEWENTMRFMELLHAR